MRFNSRLCALAFSLPLAVGAQEWIRYAASEGGDEGFLDRTTLQTRGGVRTIWTRIEKSDAVAYEGKPLKTWFALTEVVCEHRIHRTLHEAGYTPDGTLIFETNNATAEFRPVVPGTFSEARVSAICALPKALPRGRGA